MVSECAAPHTRHVINISESYYKQKSLFSQTFTRVSSRQVTRSVEKKKGYSKCVPKSPPPHISPRPHTHCVSCVVKVDVASRHFRASNNDRPTSVPVLCRRYVACIKGLIGLYMAANAMIGDSVVGKLIGPFKVVTSYAHAWVVPCKLGVNTLSRESVGGGHLQVYILLQIQPSTPEFLSGVAECR